VRKSSVPETSLACWPFTSTSRCRSDSVSSSHCLVAKPLSAMKRARCPACSSWKTSALPSASARVIPGCRVTE
jgi:hypothetical protein